MNDNEVMVLRTRACRYLRDNEGIVKPIPNNLGVTEHSFVLSQAIEYKKRRTPKKPLPKKPGNIRVPNVTEQVRNERAKINRKANNAKRVMKPIDLNLTTVPKPIKIAQKKFSKPKTVQFSIIVVFISHFMFPFFFFALEKIFPGVQIKIEKDCREYQREICEPVIESDEERENLNPRPAMRRNRIASSTFRPEISESVSTFFSDVSSLSSSWIPSVSSGTMQLLQPIIDMAIAEDREKVMPTCLALVPYQPLFGRFRSVSSVAVEIENPTTPPQTVSKTSPVPFSAPKKNKKNASDISDINHALRNLNLGGTANALALVPYVEPNISTNPSNPSKWRDTVPILDVTMFPVNASDCKDDLYEDITSSDAFDE